MKNTLFLECRGCYFFEGDESVKKSDVGNYRVCTIDDIHAKNGRDYFLEFKRYDKRQTRTTHKITGEPLKHPKTETVLPCALHIDAQFEDGRGTWGDLKLTNELYKHNYTFTKENILKVVNEIAITPYDNIILVSADEIVHEIPKIYKIGGFREKSIIDDLVEIKTKENNNNYWVFSFFDSLGNSFDYEYRSKRITG